MSTIKNVAVKNAQKLALYQKLKPDIYNVQYMHVHDCIRTVFDVGIATFIFYAHTVKRNLAVTARFLTTLVLVVTARFLTTLVLAVTARFLTTLVLAVTARFLTTLVLVVTARFLTTLVLAVTVCFVTTLVLAVTA